MPPILHLPSISSLLLQLVSPEASPHTALLITSTGAIISLQSVEPEAPWPNYGLGEKGKEARGRMYSALAAAEWKEEGLTEGVLKLEMEIGRMTILPLGIGAAFLLVLVGCSVAPWSVLEKKTRLADEALREPLERIAL